MTTHAAHVLLRAAEDDFGPGPGASESFMFGEGFVVLFVLVAVAGVIGTAWKVNAARSMARRSGMNPDEATAMTLLTDDGLEATYLAANLRPAPAAPAPDAAAAPVAAADRLQALQDLKDRGLITEAEHATRRQAIIDAI